MALGELPDAERTCKNCHYQWDCMHHVCISRLSCAFSAYVRWREERNHYRARVDNYIAELEHERDEALEDARAARRERDEAVRVRDEMDTDAQHRAERYCHEKRLAERERDELKVALRKSKQSCDFWHQRFYYSGQRAELAERERDELKGQLAKAKAKLAAAEKERDALAEAWLTVCHEGNVPQYGGATQADPGGILHGVRQLASMWSAEKWLREVVERARDELREKLAKGGA